MNNPLLKIKDYGQSIWMDNLNRNLIESGELQDLIETYGLRGVTSNPAIFEKAIANSDVYNADITDGIKAGKPVEEIYESLIFADIRHTCDIFRPIYQESGGLDGYVSIEVSPNLAHDDQRTLEEVGNYYRAIDRENVMIKIPGTPEGFRAVEAAISQGINVNITLLFSVDSYVEAAWAYIRGLERRVAQGEPIDKLASVASFFLSRIDTKIDHIIDQRLQRIGTESQNEEARLSQVQGKVAIANAKIAYQKYKDIISTERWQALAVKGANQQRLLWASTSTKNPAYSDVMYIDQLIAANTVNTVPLPTLKACADHCHVAPNQIETNLDKAYTLLESLKESDININLEQVMHELLDEGIDLFVQPYQSLLQSLENKVKQLSPI